MLLDQFSYQAFRKHKYSSLPEEFSNAVRRGWVQPRETLETKEREGFAVEVVKMLYYIFALEVFTVYSGGIITLRLNLRQYITPQKCIATRREVSTNYHRIRGERERIHFNSLTSTGISKYDGSPLIHLFTKVFLKSDLI